MHAGTRGLGMLVTLCGAALLPMACAADLPAVPTVKAPSVGITTGCDWTQGPSAQQRNSGFLDERASYYYAVLPVDAQPGDRIEVRGRYAQARYFSFQVYDGNRPSNLIDKQSDATLVSDQGRQPDPNPAVLPLSDGDTDTYTLSVVYEAVPQQRAPNTLYAGSRSRRLALAKQLLYRIYLPNPGVDSLGGVPLPELTFVRGDGSRTPLAQSPDAGRCSVLQQLLAQNLRSVPGVGIAPGEVRFKPVTSGGLYPNGDSHYLRAVTARSYADMVVVRARAPLTPVLPPAVVPAPQVRYWSVCQDELYSTAVVACLADRDAVLQPDGSYTVVISTAARRPPLADAAHGYNWLPWGQANVALLALRQILPAPGFAGDYQAAIDAYGAPLASVTQPPLQDSLGEWAPQASYCDADTFAAYAAAGGESLIEACAAAHRRLLAQPLSPLSGDR